MDPDSKSSQAGASSRRPPGAEVSSSRGVQVGDHNVQHNVFVEQRAVAAPVALAQLPPLAAAFTGREAELAQVADLLAPSAGGGAVVVSAVAGLAGVGKTALAVHAAHAAREAGWFAGGVLFIDLHGYDEQPVQPGQALDALLRAMGVPGEHIPEGAEQRSGLYRSTLARVEGPVLVVADNASAEAQVRPLLPGPGPHRVIVTSRHTLAGLGARLLDVTVLDQAAAVSLLDTVLRAARPDDDRVGGDLAAAVKLTEVSGGLPLALQIMAALLAADPALSAAELADEMTDEVRRLKALRYDDGSGAGAPSVAAAFELSYRQLDQDAARLFRLLPAAPGPDVSTEAAAELAGWPVDRARAVIGRLVRAHLVEPAGVRGRWRMHDLLRVYARETSNTTDDHEAWKAALARITEYYKRRTAFLAACLRPHLREELEAAARLAEASTLAPNEAMAVFEAELQNLLAALALASDQHFDEAVFRMAEAMNNALWRLWKVADVISSHQVALDTARSAGNQEEEARALRAIGIAYVHYGQVDQAILNHRQALEIDRATSNRRSEMYTLSALGYAYAELRQFKQAISCHNQALPICRHLGDKHQEAHTLGNLGADYVGMGQYQEALTYYQDAIIAYRSIDYRYGEGIMLDSIGGLMMELGRPAEAIAYCQDALTIYREAGDRHGEGVTLNTLGNAYQELRQPGRAVECWREAAAVMRDVGDHEAAERLEQLAAGTRSRSRRRKP